MVNVGLPAIMATFGVTADQIEWVLTAYLLMLAVMLPTSGWVADHFGCRRTHILTLALFTFGSFLCGLMWGNNSLVFFRIIQGACGITIACMTAFFILRREAHDQFFTQSCTQRHLD